MDTQQPNGFFTEDNGKNSSMRLMSFLSLLASMLFGYLTIKLPIEQGATGIYITFAFLVAAFSPKLIQKFAEEKLPSYQKPQQY